MPEATGTWLKLMKEIKLPKCLPFNFKAQLLPIIQEAADSNKKMDDAYRNEIGRAYAILFDRVDKEVPYCKTD